MVDAIAHNSNNPEDNRITAIKYEPGVPAPQGYMLVTVVTPDGQKTRCWVDPDDISTDSPKRSTLSEEQKQRAIKAVRAFGYHCSDETDETVVNTFEKDMEPEGEISIWEAAAVTYLAEKIDRDSISQHDDLLLFYALTQFCTGVSVQEALSIHPPLKRLSNLQRVHERFHENYKNKSRP